MSGIRGIFPLFLATAIGIGNGIYAFGPAFKEQQELKNNEAGKPLEATGEVKEDEFKEGEFKEIRASEAAASKFAATEAALKQGGSSSSWWPRLLWTGNVSGDKTKPSTDSVSEAIKEQGGKEAGEK